MNLIPGQTFEWFPQIMKGKDGNTYPVFTMFASGRGWASKKYFTPKGKFTNPIVRALHTNLYQREFKNIVGVDIIQGFDMEILTFNKSPYVRKDGGFRVTVDEGVAWGLPQFGLLGGVYAVSRTEPYTWDSSKGTSWVESYYNQDVTSGHLVKGKLHYLTNILHTNGNLIKI